MQAAYDISVPFSFWHKLHCHTLYTYLNSYLLGAPREYVWHVLVLGSDWTSCQLSSTCILLVCLGPPSILLFVPPFHVSHVHPPLPIGQLNTSIQVNNMAILHLRSNSHTYLHHIHITMYSLLHTSSTLLGRPAGPDSSCWEQDQLATNLYLYLYIDRVVKSWLSGYCLSNIL